MSVNIHLMPSVNCDTLHGPMAVKKSLAVTDLAEAFITFSEKTHKIK